MVKSPRTTTILAYTFRLMLLSVAIVALTFAGVMYAALQRSVSDWNALRNQNLQTTISATIRQHYRAEGELTPDLLQQVLRPLLSPTMYVIIADSERSPLYAFVGGSRMPIEPERSLDSLLEEVPGEAPLPNVLIDGGEVFGYAAAASLGFTSDPLNQRFLRSMGLFLLIGTSLAVGIGLLAAAVLSRTLSGHTRRVAALLSQLSRGERDAAIPREYIAEFHTILGSVRTLQEQLKHEEELRRRWARDVAHDLRTPITALKTQFEAMQEQVVTPTPERFGRLHAEIQRIERLVQDLRALNSIEEPQRALEQEQERFPAREFLESCIRGFQTRQLSVDCHIDCIYGDYHRLQRAVINLIQNALQHGIPQRPVRIIAAGSEIRVVSHGEIPAEDLPYVFERLYRGEASRSSSGSGLGLSIAQAIIEQHGGSIGIDCADGMTEVRVQLPEGRVA